MAYEFGGSAITSSDGYLLPTLEMMKNMSMHMGEYFYFSTTVKNFVFEDLHFHGSAGVVCVCLIIFSFTVMLEGTKSLIFYLRLRQNQNPLTYGRTETSIQTERSPLFSALMIPSSVSEIKRKRSVVVHVGGIDVSAKFCTKGKAETKWLNSAAELLVLFLLILLALLLYTPRKKRKFKFHIGGYLLHTVDLSLAYLLMLAVMSYDAYILIAVILGSGVGYFVFGAINTRNKVKYQALQMSLYDRYDSQAGLTNSEPSSTSSRYGSNENTSVKSAR